MIAVPVASASLNARICVERMANPPPDYGSVVSLKRENVEHGGVAHFLEFRRIDEPGLACAAWPRCDRHILLAANLEGHRRCGEAGADIDFPQLVERGVVEGGNGAVHEREGD